MTDLDELRVAFFQECEDLLESLSNGLRDLADGPAQDEIELVHSVFRAVHSIKGGAGAFALEDLVGFAHLFETVLDNLRSGKAESSPDMMSVLLRAGDMLYELVQAARDNEPPPAARLMRLEGELEELTVGLEDEYPGDFVFEPISLDFDPPNAAPDDPVEERRFEIVLTPHGEMYMRGSEPTALIMALNDLGMVTVQPQTDRIRPLDLFDANAPQLSWTITLVTNAPESEITGVFDFVEDLAEIGVTHDPAAWPEPAADEPGADYRGPPPQEQSPAVATPSNSTPAERVPHLTPAASPSAPATPPAVQPVAKQVNPAPPATIRVNLDRVDRLINLIGELVIMEAVLSRIVADAGLESNSDAVAGLDRIRQLADEIQEGIMAIRAQPLRGVFQRMERILREVSDATGKKARLVTNGAETEVDKTVIERLVDPLTHMIRNSIDHGLEDAERRVTAGKDETGRITLSAAHRSGRVLIEIADDGGGIDRQRVRRIAEKKGLVSPAAALTPGEIDAILFTPGFSSKADVSAVSGRGVGLDVVQREIQALGGRITIRSSEGEGSVFTIALPLTLAVLDGMVVEAGGEALVLPLTSVTETLGPASTTLHRMGREGHLVANRGSLIPLVDLAERLGLAATADAGEDGVVIVIEGDAGVSAALLVDRILDQRQVVIKSLEENYGVIPGVSAATILGDGRIALIVDPEDILRGMKSDAPGAGLLVGGVA